MAEMDTAAALWAAVVASGIYHGVNPGMGWPLAVSAALMDRSRHGVLHRRRAIHQHSGSKNRTGKRTLT